MEIKFRPTYNWSGWLLPRFEDETGQKIKGTLKKGGRQIKIVRIFLILRRMYSCLIMNLDGWTVSNIFVEYFCSMSS